MWRTPSQELMILGGSTFSSKDSTEILQENSDSIEGWKMKIGLKYTCSIDLGETIVITGGGYTKSDVSEYNEFGFHKELPKLKNGRYGHGCSSYVDSDYNMVRKQIMMQYLLSLFTIPF